MSVIAVNIKEINILVSTHIKVKVLIAASLKLLPERVERVEENCSER